MNNHSNDYLMGIFTGIFLVFVIYMLCGCGLRKPIKADAAVPTHCITGMRMTKQSVCKTTVQPDWALCDKVEVRYECVDYSQGK